MITKDKWAQIIKDWQNSKIPEIIPREKNIIYESEIKRAIALIGPRRSGKTYELFIIIKKISEKYGRDKTIYINFERADLGVIDYKDLVIMLETYYDIFPKNKKERVWLFLDEIQNVSEWEKFVRTCLDNGIKVFISGSSSKLLSKEIATSMRGRNISYTTLPFSFKEYLITKSFEVKKYYSSEEKSLLNNHLEDYFLWGGYPEAVIYQEERKKILEDIFNTAILRDVIERNKIRNTNVLKNFLSALLTAKEFSINKFYNYLKSKNIKVSKNSLYNYLNNFEDAFFIFPLKKFNLSYKKEDQSLPKIYFIDNGLLTINGIDDKGRLMENLVFIELLRRDKKIFYYQNPLKEEVDFLLTEGKKVKELVQVCYNIEDFTTFSREINILLKASDKFNCDKLIVITKSKESEEKINNKKVKFIPLWKWLLEKE